MRFVFRHLVILALAVSGIAVAIPWQPDDIILVVLLGVAHIHGERQALWSAIILGLAADLFSAAPYGMLLLVYPIILGVRFILGNSVITNRSTWSLAAYAVVGTLLLHGGVYLGETLSVFLSRQRFTIDMAPHMVSALITNTAVLVLWVYFRNYFVRRYESRFLRRGAALKLYTS